MAYRGMTYPETGKVPPPLSTEVVRKENNGPKQEKPLKARTRKQVNFSPETNLEQDCDNARPQSCFWRPSSFYSPGAHASPSKGGWANTSFKNSIAYGHRQIKVIKLTPNEANDLGFNYMPFISMEAIAESDKHLQTDTAAAWKEIEQDPYWPIWYQEMQSHLADGNFGKFAYALLVVYTDVEPKGICDIYVAGETESVGHKVGEEEMVIITLEEWNKKTGVKVENNLNETFDALPLADFAEFPPLPVSK